MGARKLAREAAEAEAMRSLSGATAEAQARTTDSTNGQPLEIDPVDPCWPWGGKIGEQRPTVQKNNRGVAQPAAEILKHLGDERGEIEVFAMGDNIMAKGRLSGPKAVEKTALGTLVSKCVKIVEITKTKEGEYKESEKFLGTELRDAIASYPEKTEFLRPMYRIAGSPFFAWPDGDMHGRRKGKTPVFASDPGYSSDGGVWLEASQEFCDSVNELVGGTNSGRSGRGPTAMRFLMNELLFDFPFDCSASRTNCLAYLLQPMIRDLIDGPAPLFQFEAPVARTGKTLLAKVCSEINFSGSSQGSSGNGFAFVPPARNPEELGKNVFSAMRKSPSSVLIDNVGQEFRSGEMDSTLTAYPTIEPRVLGKLENLEFRNNITWAITANNLNLRPDSAKRMVPIRLNANVENPETMRKFDKGDIIGWAQENRAKCVAALALMVIEWINAGCPSGSARLGGFEAWAEIMSGILEVNGRKGTLFKTDIGFGKRDMWSDREEDIWGGKADLLSNRKAFLESGLLDDDDINGFVSAWVADDCDHEKLTSCNDMLMLLNARDHFELSDKSPAKSLGRTLMGHKDQVIDGYKLCARQKNKTWHWCLVKMEEK